MATAAAVGHEHDKAVDLDDRRLVGPLGKDARTAGEPRAVLVNPQLVDREMPVPGAAPLGVLDRDAPHERDSDGARRGVLAGDSSWTAGRLGFSGGANSEGPLDVQMDAVGHQVELVLFCISTTWPSAGRLEAWSRSGPSWPKGATQRYSSTGLAGCFDWRVTGRSLVLEAEVMTYVRDRGYPAPAVYDAGEGYLVMQRLEGPTMLAALRHRRGWLNTAGSWPSSTGSCMRYPHCPASRRSTGRRPGPSPRPAPVERADDGGWPNGDRLGQRRSRRSFVRRSRHVGAVRNRRGARRRFRPNDGCHRQADFLKHFLAALDARSAQLAIPVVVEDRLANRNMTEPEKARMRRMLKRAPRP